MPLKYHRTWLLRQSQALSLREGSPYRQGAGLHSRGFSPAGEEVAMKTAKRTALLGLTLTSLFLGGCLFGPVSLTEADDGTIQTIDSGDRLLVRLSGNASTGYMWVRSEPDSLTGTPLEPIEEGIYQPLVGSGVGCPGHFTFRYRAVDTGTITLTFVYQRSWEEDPIETFSVIIWVH